MTKDNDYGDFMVILWWLYGDFMVILIGLNSDSRGISYVFDGTSNADLMDYE